MKDKSFACRLRAFVFGWLLRAGWRKGVINTEGAKKTERERGTSEQAWAGNEARTHAAGACRRPDAAGAKPTPPNAAH